jgi:hypothetical protein
MLEDRNIMIIILSREILMRYMFRGCHQRKCYRLCFRVWSWINFYEDTIIILYNKICRRYCNSYYWKSLSHCVRVVKIILDTEQHWCSKTYPSINPNETAITPTRKKNIKGLNEPTLFGKEIQISTEDKYLGPTLGKGLNWETQLDKVTITTYRDFRTCRGTFGRTWGLRSKVVHWMYTIVVISTIIYAATVWWPRVKFKANRAELSKLESLASLDNVGSMGMAPTTALEILLWFPPLHLQLGA